MDDAAHVVVIGGGIMGAATTYYLARRGIGVVLFEKEVIGAEASGANAGGVRQHGRSRLEYPFGMASIQLWKDLHTELGVDVEYRQVGHARVAQTEAEIPELEETVCTGQEFGLDIDMISARAFRELVPDFRGPVAAAYLAPTDGYANPLIAPIAFARAAQRLGARVHQRSPVSSVVVNGPFDFTVEAQAQSIRARVVVNAAGAWAGQISRMAGLDLPVTLRFWQTMVTERAPQFLGPVVTVKAFGENQVVRNLNIKQMSAGTVVISGAWEGEGGILPERKTVTFDGIVGSARDVTQCFPCLGSVGLLRVWVGLEGTLPDSSGVVGPVAAIPGYLLAAAFSGHGFALGPIVGTLLAEYIDTGKTSLDLTPLTFDRRFAAGV